MKQRIKKIQSFFEKYREYLLGIFFVCVFIDLFYHAYFSDFFLIFALLLWLSMSYFLHYKSVATFKVLFSLFFVFMALFIVDQQAAHTERIVSWIAVFLVVGAIQQLIELGEKRK